MFLFKKAKTVNTKDDCLNKILSIFSNYEHDMINGKYNLCLTVEFLMFFDDLYCNLNNDLVEETFREKYQLKVDKLRSSFKNLTLLKVTCNLKESFKLKFDLKYFKNLKSLELENVYIDNILNLNEVISQLTTIKLNRCLSSKPIEEFFLHTADVCTSLKCLSISRTVFRSEEFNFLPNRTQTLQLQWNQIKQFKLNCLTQNNLRELDLSFNKLTQIPRFDEGDPVCNTLNTLKLKGNLIDSLKNIETLTQLEHLDLSANLICNKDEIGKYLSACKKLKILNLIDNPVQMFELDSLSVLIFETFPGLRKLNNHLCYTEKSSDKESTSSSIVVSNNYFEDINSIISKNEDSPSNSNSLRASTVKRKARVAVILDRTDSFVNNTDDEQSDQDRLSSVSTNVGLSLGLENNYSDLKEIIANQRKSLGKKLLNRQPIVQNLVAPYSTPEQTSDCGSYNIIGEMHTIEQNLASQQKTISSISPAQMEEQLKAKFKDLAANEDQEIAVSMKDDNGLVLNLDSRIEENEDKRRKDSNNSLSPKEDNLWANEDMDDGENVFLVNKWDSNQVEIEDPIFILIKDSLIYEKDCATGRIFETYDLNGITAFELENSTTVSLIFDSKVKSKQKVTYNLETEIQLEKFGNQFLDPFIMRNQEEKLNQRFKYECLKCGSKNAEQTECGTCKSTALIESTNYNTQLSQSEVNAQQSSYKEDFLNQVKIKLTSNNDQSVKQQVSSQETLSAPERSEEQQKEEFINSNESIDKTTDRESNEHSQFSEEEGGEEAISLINSKLENYDLEQFTSVDHELKLHLDVKIFTNNERLEHLFECDFSINDTSEMSHGRIVTTNTSLHLIAFKSENVNDSSNVLFDTFTMPLNKIKNIKLSRDYFFHQCVWLTVDKLSGKKKKKKHLVEIQTFFIILKDKKLVDLFCDYLESFLNKQEIKMKTNVNTYSLTEKPVKLDTEENIIFSQFIVSLTTKSDLEISKSSCDDLLCLLFEKGCEIILTRCEVIANELKFKKICRNDLTNLLAAKLESNCQQLHLYFSKDSNNSKLEWIIGSYSVNSMSKMIELISTIWQNIYKIDLQIHIAN